MPFPYIDDIKIKQHNIMAHTLVINEGVLNDDELLIAENGKCFNHNPKYKYAVRYWTYANEWCNHPHVFYATTPENALKRYKRETKLRIENEIDLLSCAHSLSTEA